MRRIAPLLPAAKVRSLGVQSRLVICYRFADFFAMVHATYVQYCESAARCGRQRATSTTHRCFCDFPRTVRPAKCAINRFHALFAWAYWRYIGKEPQ